MKKFIASILAVCMVLTSMCFTVSAAVEVKTDRALNVVVDKAEVYAINGKDIVTVKVVVADNRQNVTTDDQFTVAEYTLDYDPSLFTLQETNLENHDAVNGTITETFYVETIAGWTTGAELATYTFKAKPQVDVETDTFDLVSPQLYTVRESLKGDIFEAKSESKNVTILLEPYKVTKYIDGNEVNDSADDTLPDNSFPYDNNPHSFKVETVPTATVSYEVKYTAPDGTVTTSSDINNIKASIVETRLQYQENVRQIAILEELRAQSEKAEEQLEKYKGILPDGLGDVYVLEEDVVATCKNFGLTVKSVQVNQVSAETQETSFNLSTGNSTGGI